ncbi:MAG: RsfS/YbeB/iojap family protein, partial [Proteobacteria bacterium]|nr:RsfS/YbeB/iojap family protein [Pseudomonadota bacterium]
GFTAFGIEGEKDGHWILLDYSDVVIHLFYQPIREFYDLEGLWVEAPRVKINKKVVKDEN